jgi:glycogen debranching enzyme
MPLVLVQPDLLCAWLGSSLLIVNTRGECAGDQELSGFYVRETRCVRTLRLEINGTPPWLCEAAAVDPHRLSFNYTHPEVAEYGGGGTGQSGDDEPRDDRGLPQRSLDIRVDYTIETSGLRITLKVVNRAREPLQFTAAWRLGADFADIQEAQAKRREQTAPISIATSATQLEFVYEHPQLPCRTRIHHGGEWVVQDDRLAIDVTLQPQAAIDLTLTVDASIGAHDLADGLAGERAAALEAWRRGFARVELPGNRSAERVLRHNIRDIASFPLLDGPRDEWLAMQAGMPAYPAFFGRDGVTAGWQAGWLDSGESLSAALAKLARLQSARFDDWRDEQPGRIPYQVRSGPLAVLNLNPYSAYYADYASPLMFVISLANLWSWTDDTPGLRRYWDTARRILDWAREHGDMDGDGYLEYQTRSSKGTKNQGWKDSGDAIIYDDGRPVPAPIATCELQGYWYIAQQLMGLMSWALGEHDEARAYRASAAALKARFNRDWWMADEQFFALALDPGKQQVRAITSNVGHCLASGIIDRERLPAVVGRMFAPDMFSGWGVRTLSTAHRFYNPLSYHRGTVWAVEQATIAFGLRRFGFDARALDLARALFELAEHYPDDRIPECVGGYARGERPTPGAYPRANPTQLWNATAFPLIVQTLLGLLPIASLRTLVVDPLLPSWLPDLVLRDLRVGDARVTLRFSRAADGTSTFEVLHRQGTLHVVRQAPPESLTATWGERAANVVESIFQ